VPAGCDVYSQSDEGGEYLTIEQTVSKGKRALSGRRFSDVVDLAAVEGAERLRAMLLAGEPLDPLLFEHCARALRNGVRRVLCGTAVAPRASGWMTPRRLALVDEMIEARLDGRLTVQELADALGLSAGFFSRAFKAAVGKSPYDYIVDRRVSRARSLLGREGIGLSEVALASGFASHAHMTSVFHARLGVTPSALRRRLD